MKSNSSSRLNELLRYYGITQSDLIKKTGIPKSAISMYLSGQRNPRQDRLTEIAEAYSVNEAWLMGFDVPMFKTEKHHTKKAVVINVLGRVAAGIPIEAVEDVIDTEEITEELSATGEFFGLQIHGNSMEPRMKEGDVVIVRKQEDAESGDVVIALVNGDDAVCKRLKKYHDGIELISTNPSYEPIFFSQDEIEKKPVRIIGKVVELRAKF